MALALTADSGKSMVREMDKNACIFVAGARGMVGSAICRELHTQGYTDILTPSREELDLADQRDTARFFQKHKPRFVFVAAAKVGGIKANDTYPADFIYQNLLIEANLIHQSREHEVTSLMFFGSSCIYPKHADQPMREEALLGGRLEPTNEPYAIAKIAGIKLCESYNRQYGTDFRSLMPCNLYGPGDNFNLKDSHVIPAMMRKFSEAKAEGRSPVELWGSGKVYREFLHVDDLAAASVFVMFLPRARLDEVTTPMSSHLNVGTGRDLTLKALAGTIKDIVDYPGEIRWNPEMPDGTPRKVMDIGRLNALGWAPRVPLKQGLKATYRWYLEHESRLRE